jgi:uncharacterized protein (TIRG00374 family)
MTGPAREVLKYSFSIVLAILLLVIAFRDVELKRIVVVMKEARYEWLLLMFLLLMCSHLARSMRWRYLLEPLKPGIGLRNLFSGVMVGYMVNNLLPRAGEIVRPYTIGRLESISRSAALGTIVVERIMDGVSFLLLLVLVPFMYDGPLREVFPWLGDSGVILSAFMALFMATAVVLMIRRDWTTRLTGTLGRVLPERFVPRFNQIVHSFLDGFLFLKRPANFLPIFVLSVFIWGSYIAMMYVAFFAFRIDAGIGWRAAVVVLTISSIGIAIPTPGSAGGYHVFTSQTLNRLFLVPEDIALGYATLTHAVGYIGVTLVGLYFFFKDHVKISEAVQEEREPA